MRVIQISFFVDPQRRPPERLLSDWHSLADIAVAVASAGVRVTVVQASRVPGEVVRNGVEFLFLPPDEPSGLLTRSTSFTAALRDRRPDVLHVHGLGFGREVLALRGLAPNVPIFLQDHADRPPRFWRRHAWRRGAAVADGISFCARRPGRAVSTVQSSGTRGSSYSRSPSPRARFCPGIALRLGPLPGYTAIRPCFGSGTSTATRTL